MASKLKRPSVVAAVVVGVVLAAGVAKATIPDAGGSIHACYKQSSGALRVIDPSAGASCNSSEQSLDWAEQAPTGAQGIQGLQGAQGPPGPQGASGLAGLVVVSGSAFGDPVIGGFSKTLTCPTGTKALTGAWQWVFWIDNNPPTEGQSEPIGEDSWVFAAPAGSATKGLEMDVALTCVVAN